VVLAGKSPVVYLLNGEHLGGIGKQEASLSSVCSNDIDGGSAIVGMTVYLPCLKRPRRLSACRRHPRHSMCCGGERRQWSADRGGRSGVDGG